MNTEEIMDTLVNLEQELLTYKDLTREQEKQIENKETIIFRQQCEINDLKSNIRYLEAQAYFREPK